MEQYERVAALLLGMDCLVKHRHGSSELFDADWNTNERKNYCTVPDCYVRLCDHCAGAIITYPSGRLGFYCQEHAPR